MQAFVALIVADKINEQFIGMKTGTKIRLIIFAFIIGSVLGFGYWHSSTHASFHVQLGFKDASREKLKPAPKVEILFRDSQGNTLASGISDDKYNFIHLIHPVVGDCHEVEKSAASSKLARQAWQECFEHLSTWIPKWAGKVSRVDLKSPVCNLTNIPVAVSQHQSDWFLWWVPLPHIGGKPYTYYSLTITVDTKNCMD